MNEEKKYLIDGKYSIKDLVNLEKLREIFESFTQITGSTAGFISYPSQEILIAAGWREICTKFHRGSPKSNRICIESDTTMTEKLKKTGDMAIEICGNGLVYGGVPIIIKECHLGSLLGGQIFFEEPDLEKFKKQAKKYDFDEDAYLNAVKQVPIIPKEQFKKILSFLGELGVLITEMGYANLDIKKRNLELEEEIEDRLRTEHAMFESHQKEELYKRLIDFAGDGIFSYKLDTGEILFANQCFVNILGLTSEPQQLKGKFLKNILVYLEEPIKIREILKEKGETRNFEYRFKTLKGEDRWVLHNSFLRRDPNTGENIVEATVKDITDRKRFEALLQQKSEELQTILDTVPAMVFYKDKNNRYIRVNAILCEILRKSKEELEGKYMHDIYPKEQAKAFWRDDLEVITSGKAKCNIIESLETPQGRRIVKTDKIPFLDSEGNVAGIIGFAIDITEQHKIENELKDNEEKYRELFNNANTCVAVYEAKDNGNDFIIKDFNKAAEKVEKIRKEDIVGKSILKVFPGVKEFGIFKVLQEVWKTGVPQYFPVSFYQDERINGWRENYVYRLRSGEVVAAYSDITEQKKYEQTLTENADRLFTVIQNVDRGITFSDKEGHFEIFNPKMEEITGYTKEDANSHGDFIDILYHDPVERLKALRGIDEVCKKGSVPEIETIIRTKNGKEKPLLVSTSLVNYKNKDMFLSVYLDNTEHKRMQVIKDEFVSVVSHELRTPLVIIKEGINLVIDDKLGQINTDQKEALAHAKTNVDRLGHIINNLLDIAKIESRQEQIIRMPIDMTQLLTQATKELQFKAKEKKLTLKTDAPKTPILINADTDKIVEVLMNLIGNAIKFTEAGSITVALSEKTNEIECSISDTGIGIAKENLPKVFDKFQQFGRKWGPGEKGTGLGLAITKGIIELHGGKIWIESAPQKGTKISFQLPKYI